MKANRTSILIGWFYFACLVVFSILIYQGRINVQSGIILFSACLFSLCLLYSSLFRWPSQTVNRYFILLIACTSVSKIFLAFSLPLWEDDWARYLWEGHLFHDGLSPYEYAPDFFYSDNQSYQTNGRALEILSRINHPDWKTIYFPLILLYFALVAKISSFSVVALKLSYLVWDLLVCLLIVQIRDKKAGLLFYTFPIFIKETYLNSHFEILCIFFITLAIWLLQKKKYNFAMILLGLAVHSKIFLVILSPFFLVSYLRRETSKTYNLLQRSLGFVSLSFFGFSLPFFLWKGFFPSDHSFAWFPLFLFAKDFEFNSTFYYIFKTLTNARMATLFTYSTMLAFLIYSLIRAEKLFCRTRRGVQWLFVCFLLYLLVAPLANPWYFLLLTPFYFVSRNPGDGFWLLLVIPQVSYFTFTNLKFPPSASGQNGFYNIPDYIIFAEIIAIITISCLNYRKNSILLYIISNISNRCKKA